MLEKQYSVHMEFMINAFHKNGWYNLFHATISDDTDAYGSRILAIWIYHNNGNMSTTFSSAINGDSKYGYTSPTTPVQLNKWNTVTVSQNKVGGDYKYNIEMNREVIHVAKNTQPQEFEHVKVYVSNPSHSAVPGYVRNVYIKGNV